MRAMTRLRRALTLVVATALVTAQLAGLVHRVEHPAGNGNSALAALATPHAKPFGITAVAAHDHADGRADHVHAHADHGGGHAHDHAHHGDRSGQEDDGAHHCAAFDAASLADGPPLASDVSVRTRPATYAPCARLALLTVGRATVGYFSHAPPIS